MKAPAASEMLSRFEVRHSIIAPKPQKRRQAPSPSERLTQLDSLVRGMLGGGQGPRATFLYQDEETRTWAREIYERMAKLARNEGVRASWWKIDDLSAPGILAGAVSSAVKSDVIVVASRPEGLPLPFYVWVNLWWPHRPETAGALVAVIGKPGPNAPRAGRVGEYLQEVTQQARMPFLRIEKELSKAAKERPAVNGHNLNGAHKLNGSQKLHGAAMKRV
jgi:hypothetical protein